VQGRKCTAGSARPEVTAGSARPEVHGRLARWMPARRPGTGAGSRLDWKVALEPWVCGPYGVAEQIQGFHHTALFYDKSDDYFTVIQDFVRAGTEQAEPVLVAVPHDELPANWRLPAGSPVMFVDMRRLGANPARIIPALQTFADRHPGKRVRYLAESVWPTRPAAEQLAAARHEALVNLAFADAQVTMLCLYNVAALPEAAISRARSTHPTLFSDGTERDSLRYHGPAGYLDGLDERLPSPPDSATTLSYERDLRPLRALVIATARQAGLDASRCTDLVIAASEVAANTLRHTRAGGVLRLWQTDSEVLCQIEDHGHIRDPLAGYHRPADGMPGGQGLWLVNQVCDLVEIKTGRPGTTVRLNSAARLKFSRSAVR
jgi:anti-sigma regulatory factor (Ser/Thr protein kinase)